MDSFRKQLSKHEVCFFRRGRILVVSFDFAFAEKIADQNQERIPWGYEFFKSSGYSHLGIVVKKTDWYRSPDLHIEMQSLSRNGLFNQFDRVVFAGGSMGGYGAAAFSSLHPGSIVVALNPQSSLAPKLTPWETRFVIGQRQNWDGLFSDAAVEAESAAKVYIVYDPYHKLDKKHVDRFKGSNIARLRMPFFDHHIPVHLKRLGILKEFMKSAIEKNISPDDFSKLLRNRRQDSVHWKKNYHRCANKRRWATTLRVINYCLPRCDAKNPNRSFFASRMALHIAKKGNMKLAHQYLLKENL